MIDLISKAINGKYYNNNNIKRSKNTWILPDNVKIRTNGLTSFGFCLDDKQNPPFGFLRNSPPKHLAKMCDAIIVFTDDNTMYFAIIEQKTGQEGHYEKQIANGKLFCEWLVGLCETHYPRSYHRVEYFGILIWQPPPVPMKSTTTLRLPVAQNHNIFHKYFDLEHIPQFSLRSLINA